MSASIIAIRYINSPTDAEEAAVGGGDMYPEGDDAWPQTIYAAGVTAARRTVKRQMRVTFVGQNYVIAIERWRVKTGKAQLLDALRRVRVDPESVEAVECWALGNDGKPDSWKGGIDDEPDLIGDTLAGYIQEANCRGIHAGNLMPWLRGKVPDVSLPFTVAQVLSVTTLEDQTVPLYRYWKTLEPESVEDFACLVKSHLAWDSTKDRWSKVHSSYRLLLSDE